jgi:endonuclease/exonuclease/phosphatase family metal-dependent hydrolase
MKKNKSLLGGFLKMLSLLTLVLLWLSILAIVVPPHILPILGLITLGFPIFFLIHIVFLFWYIYKGEKYLWVLLITSFFTLPSFHSWVSLGNQTNDHDLANSFSIMTYNVRMFNVYSWINDVDVPTKQRDLVKDASADILVLQEYYASDITPAFGYPYEYIAFSNPQKTFGLATFSRYPIVNQGSVPYEHTDGFNNQFSYVDIVNEHDTIRVMNIHLASFYFDVKDFEALRQGDLNNIDELSIHFRSFVKRLFEGFARRSKQLKTIKRFIEDSPYPLFACGDMNDVPASHTYRVFNRLLNDSFRAAKRGVGRTYVETRLPLRIDWIFHPESYQAVTHETRKQNKALSDHLPVYVTFVKMP